MGCRQEYCLENMLVEKIMREHKLVQQVAAEEQLQIFSEPELVPSKYYLHSDPNLDSMFQSKQLGITCLCSVLVALLSAPPSP